MSAPLHAIKSLEVYDVKIYEVKDQKLSVKTRGKLELLYLPEYDRFLLTLNSFRYVLSPNIFILASLHEKRAYRSYFLPGVKRHYILKLKAQPTAAVLGNLETIFASYSHLTYKEDQQQELAAQLNNQDPNNVSCSRKTSEDYARTVGKYITKGGEGFKQNMFKFANYLGKGLQKKSSVEPPNENQLYTRNIDELKSINDFENQCLDLDRTKILKLFEVSNQIGQEQSEQQPQAKNGGGWNDLKKGTVTGLKSLWAGLDEAATIFGSSMSKKKNKNKDKNRESLQSPSSQNQSSTDPDSSNSGEMPDFSSDNFVDSILYAPPIPQQEINYPQHSPHNNMYNVQGSPHNNIQPVPYNMQQQQVIYNNVPQQHVIYNNMSQQQVQYSNGQPMINQGLMSPQQNVNKSLFGETEMVKSQYVYVDNKGNQIQGHQPQAYAQIQSQPQQSVYFADASMHIQVYPQLGSLAKNK